jgi:hypothetical protein
MLTKCFLERRDQTGYATRKVCYFYTKNVTRPEERKGEERKEMERRNGEEEEKTA